LSYLVCKYYDNWQEAYFTIIIRAENFHRINERLQSEDKSLMAKKHTYTFEEAKIVRRVLSKI